jgi:hypothetical protein
MIDYLNVIASGIDDDVSLSQCLVPEYIERHPEIV